MAALMVIAGTAATGTTPFIHALVPDDSAPILHLPASGGRLIAAKKTLY